MEVRPGYKQTDVGVIPEDWDTPHLDSLGSGGIPAIKAGPFGSSLTKAQYVAEGYKVYGQEQVIRGNYLFGDYFISAKKYRELESCAVRPGDVLLSLVGTAGKLLEVPDVAQPGVINPRLLRFSFDRSKVLPRFFKYQFESDLVQSRLSRHAQGGTMGVLNAGALRPFQIPLPTLPEQRAIAAVLSDMDALLCGLDRLIAKKSNLKQAAMQQLLTGQTRLPGFRGDWSVKMLSNFSEITKGQGLSKDKLSLSGECPCILYGELFTTYREKIDTVYSSTSIREGRLSKTGDVLIPGSTTTTGIDLAKASALLCPNVLLGGDINIIRPVPNSCDSVFLAYSLTHVYKNAIAHRTKGITIYHLHGKDLRDLEINLPEVSEQNAIATLLSDMDAELAALEARRDKTRALKQAMMQELLTGKTRLVPTGAARA